MNEERKRQHLAAVNVIRRLTAAAISFLLLFGLLNLVDELTVETKWVLSGFVGISVLLLGPKIWAWLFPVWP